MLRSREFLFSLIFFFERLCHHHNCPVMYLAFIGSGTVMHWNLTVFFLCILNKKDPKGPEMTATGARDDVSIWLHYNDVIMTTIASQITSLTVVYSRVYTDADQRNIKAPRHWPLCGEFTGVGEFPAQRASYAENVSIWWRHHEWDRSWMLAHFSTSPHTKNYSVKNDICTIHNLPCIPHLIPWIIICFADLGSHQIVVA